MKILAACRDIQCTSCTNHRNGWEDALVEVQRHVDKRVRAYGTTQNREECIICHVLYYVTSADPYVEASKSESRHDAG